jgi:hypothetical protein
MHIYHKFELAVAIFCFIMVVWGDDFRWGGIVTSSTPQRKKVPDWVGRLAFLLGGITFLLTACVP